ncbi:MAG TPA: response regulator [Polyangia bacterium]|nr:response regulator [Polyangia bacterium]
MGRSSSSLAYGGEPAPSILVADDDALLRSALARDLRARGYEVRTAGSYEQALQAAARHPPDLAILDLRIGDRSGLEILEALRESSPHVSAVVMSGFGSIATAVEAMRLGAVNFVTKPVDVDELLVALLRPRAEPQPAARPDDDWRAPSVARAEWEHISRVVAECGGNISEAARRMGMHRRSLQRKLHKRPPRR